MEQVQSKNPACTVYSLMEPLGLLSFNFSAERLAAWQVWLIDAYGLTVIWSVDPLEANASFSFRAEIFERPFERMLAHRIYVCTDFGPSRAGARRGNLRHLECAPFQS